MVLFDSLNHIDKLINMVRRIVHCAFDAIASIRAFSVNKIVQLQFANLRLKVLDALMQANRFAAQAHRFASCLLILNLSQFLRTTLAVKIHSSRKIIFAANEPVVG
jgi:hypothetical protein